MYVYHVANETSADLPACRYSTEPQRTPLRPFVPNHTQVPTIAPPPALYAPAEVGSWATLGVRRPMLWVLRTGVEVQGHCVHLSGKSSLSRNARTSCVITQAPTTDFTPALRAGANSRSRGSKVNPVVGVWVRGERCAPARSSCERR